MEDRIASVLASQLDDHLTGLRNFPYTGADRGQHTRRIGPELRKADPVLGEFDLCFGGIDLRLRRLQRLRRIVVVGARRPALLEERVLTFEVIACLCQLPARSGQIGLRRAQGVQLVLRFETRDELAGFDPIAKIDVALEYPA